MTSPIDGTGGFFPNIDYIAPFKGAGDEKRGGKAQPLGKKEDIAEPKFFGEKKEAKPDRPTEKDIFTKSTANSSNEEGDEKKEGKKSPGELSDEEKRQVEQLKSRDREVRTHEQAHKAVAGQYARGGPTYTYQKGPDGRQYAVGGEVQIDASPVSGNPEASIRKAQVIRRAALAPAEPSGSDRRVAASATQMEQKARAEQREEAQEEAKTDFSGAKVSTDSEGDETKVDESSPVRGESPVSNQLAEYIKEAGGSNTDFSLGYNIFA